MARLDKQKESKNFKDKTYGGLVPMRPGASFLPSHKEIESGLDPFLNTLFIKALNEMDAARKLMPAIHRYNDFRQPSYIDSIGEREPYWEPELAEEIRKYRKKWKKEQAEDLEDYKAGRPIRKRKSEFEQIDEAKK
jgi:hypothetical protein